MTASGLIFGSARLREEIGQRLIDHQFDRAARWLRANPGNTKPPYHIREKIVSRVADFQRAGLVGR